MGQVTGFLLKVSEKPTSNGGTIYNIQVENDGNDDWFGYGFEAPTFGVDSEISFDIEVNGKFENVIVETLEIIENVNPPAAKRKARGGAGGGRAPRGGAAPARGARGGAADKPARQPRGSAAKEPAARAPKADKKADVDWDRKDRLIRAQSCQNTAIATVALMHAAGVLPKPKTKADGYDALQALIEKESHRLFDKYDEVADEVCTYGEESGGAEEKSDYDDGDGIPE
jgi:hypothetical protein